jgi:hypothetical protein
MEVANVEHDGRDVTLVGTQLGAAYELRYRLEPRILSLELAGQRSLDVTRRAPTSSQAPVERISRVNPPFGFRVRPVSGEIPPCGPSHARNIGRMADN